MCVFKNIVMLVYLIGEERIGCEGVVDDVRKSTRSTVAGNELRVSRARQNCFKFKTYKKELEKFYFTLGPVSLNTVHLYIIYLFFKIQQF